jgi:hypothetical protein
MTRRILKPDIGITITVLQPLINDKRLSLRQSVSRFIAVCESGRKRLSFCCELQSVAFVYWRRSIGMIYHHRRPPIYDTHRRRWFRSTSNCERWFQCFGHRGCGDCIKARANFRYRRDGFISEVTAAVIQKRDRSNKRKTDCLRPGTGYRELDIRLSSCCSKTRCRRAT